MFTDNDDVLHLPALEAGRAVSCQTRPEPWSYNASATVGGDCGGDKSDALPAWLNRPCPLCRAEVGEVCSIIGGPEGGDPRPTPHAPRVSS